MSDPKPPGQFVRADLRIDYNKGTLLESDASDDPIEQFARWFDAAQSAEVPEANAMTLATATADAIPSARIVLLKGFDRRGFCFFTNYDSRKGEDLAHNPRAALVFYWQPLERQVRIEGRVEKVSSEESERYFHSRPHGAQLGAWASGQSQVIASREDLARQIDDVERRFEGQIIPLPAHWGGFRVLPSVVEFWQGRADRLHDRLRYGRYESGWLRERLSP